MAREEVEYVVSGVSQATFDAHTHGYRKITQLGVDGLGNYSSPARIAIQDDSEVDITDSNKVAAVGITVATAATEVPS